MNLRETVALMRELGIVEYEHKDVQLSFKIVLSGKPWVQSPEAGPADRGPEAGAEEAEAAPPAAYSRLPVAYRDPRLYGGKFPKLGGGET